MNIKKIFNQYKYQIYKTANLLYNTDYIVFGEGNLNARVLIIGEALGAKEEEQKRIFIGKSGVFLRNCLQKVNINSFFMINTLPIRPKNNRTPTISEILKFSFYTKNVILLKQFKIILCLGKSAKNLVELLNLNHIIYNFHPAYIFYKRDPKIIIKFMEKIYYVHLLNKFNHNTDNLYEILYYC